MPPLVGDITTADQLLGDVLRLEEIQNRFTVGGIEIVGLGEGVGPISAVAVCDFNTQEPTPLLRLYCNFTPRASDGPL